MPEKIDLGIADDYAVLKTTTPGGGRWKFYYGYEYADLLRNTGQKDDDDDPDAWGFVADLPNDGRIHLSEKEILAEIPDQWNYARSPEERLLIAIGILLERGVLVLNLSTLETPPTEIP